MGVLLFLGQFICAQSSINELKYTKDSLKIELKNAKHDSTKCNVLNYLVEVEADEAIWPKYNDEIKRIAESNLKIVDPNSALGIFYQKRLSEVFNNIGYLKNNLGNINEALINYKLSIDIQEKIKYKRGLGGSYNNIGILYQNIGKIDTALIYFVKGLKVAENVSDIRGMAYLSENIGTVYLNKGLINKALEFFFKALKLQETSGDNSGLANVLNNIGIVYDNQGDDKKALEYYLKALKINESIGNKIGIANSFNNIGVIYQKKYDLENALTYENKSLILYEELGNIDGIANTSSNIALVYYGKGELDNALKFNFKALAIQEEIKNIDGMANTLNHIGEIYRKKRDYKLALQYCLKSLKYSQTLGYPDAIRNAAMELSKIYKVTGDYQKAFESFDLYISMRDSVNNQETKKASIKSQLKYEYEKQAASDSVKHAQAQKVKDAQFTAQNASLKQQKTQRYVLYGGLLLFVGILIFMINRFRITQRQKALIQKQKVFVDEAYEKLHEKNKEVLDSIHYAQRIQKALITSEKYIDKQLNKLNKDQ